MKALLRGGPQDGRVVDLGLDFLPSEYLFPAQPLLSVVLNDAEWSRIGIIPHDIDRPSPVRVAVYRLVDHRQAVYRFSEIRE